MTRSPSIFPVGARRALAPAALATALALATVLGVATAADAAEAMPASAVTPATGPTMTGDKIKITRQDDLPRHSYEVPGRLSDLVTAPDAFERFAASLRADLESDLDTYSIEDKNTLKGLQSTLMTLDLIDGRYDDALERLAIVRELEDKEAQRLLSGLSLEARIATIRDLGKVEVDDAFRQAFRRHYSARVQPLPWDVVQDAVQGAKGHLEMLSKNMLLGIIEEQLEPMVAKTGRVGGDIAAQVVAMRDLFRTGFALKDDAVAVLQKYVDAHKEEKEDIWAARAADLTGADKLHPVNVAIWDTGVDLDVFKDHLVVNTNERLDGDDTDGNGFVDDVHGIAYDMHWNRTTGLIYPMDEATRPIAALQADFKGFFDLQAALDTPESQAIRRKMASLAKDEARPFFEDLGRFASYCHGTHVGGIATDGNPAARILVARLTADPRLVPDPPTMADSERAATAVQDVVDYFKAHDVRVVNMSWVIARSSFEHDLELNGIGETADERKRLAREMFDVIRDGLLAAFKSAPEILFVGGAGNSDNDVTFDEFVPPMFDLPNLLIAGAVDQAGDATGFTSFGSTVNVYSNGFEVDSYVPGGDRMKLSGTSMAAPNVTNLAAKLIAVDPELKPAEVIALIVQGADERQEGERVMRIINPKRSLELLQEKMAAAM